MLPLHSSPGTMTLGYSSRAGIAAKRLGPVWSRLTWETRMRTSVPVGGEGVETVVRCRAVRWGPREGRVQMRMVGGRGVEEAMLARQRLARWKMR